MFNKKAANPRSELQTPGEIKRREVELGSHKWVDCLVGELFSKTPGEILFSKTPGEIKRREVDWTLLAGWIVLLRSCSSTVAFRTLSLWLCFSSC